MLKDASNIRTHHNVGGDIHGFDSVETQVPDLSLHTTIVGVPLLLMSGAEADAEAEANSQVAPTEVDAETEIECTPTQADTVDLSNDNALTTKDNVVIDVSDSDSVELV